MSSPKAQVLGLCRRSAKPAGYVVIYTSLAATSSYEAAAGTATRMWGGRETGIQRPETEVQGPASGLNDVPLDTSRLLFAEDKDDSPCLGEL